MSLVFIDVDGESTNVLSIGSIIETNPLINPRGLRFASFLPFLISYITRMIRIYICEGVGRYDADLKRPPGPDPDPDPGISYVKYRD